MWCDADTDSVCYLMLIAILIAWILLVYNFKLKFDVKLNAPAVVFYSTVVQTFELLTYIIAYLCSDVLSLLFCCYLMSHWLHGCFAIEWKQKYSQSKGRE